MRGRRGFLSATAITLIAVGVIRGTVVSLVAHVSLHASLKLVTLNVLVALVWLPLTFTAARVVDGKLTKSQRALALIVLGVISIIVEAWLSAILRFAGAPIPRFLQRLIGRSDTDALFYIAIVGACFAARGRRRQIASELAAARMRSAATGAQLHVLTLQLHPHFLFNALNLISQLAYESVDAAQRAVANLRALLVESLEHAVHREVSLADELSFLRAYLEIQQARFRDRLRVRITADPDAERAAVPHLVLQPIVENAIVHGISPRAAAGSIDITAKRSGGRLILSVEDDGNGVPSNVRDGMGLTNTRLRLEQLFGADHRLTLTPCRARGTVVEIDIPFRQIDDTAVDVDQPIDSEPSVAEDLSPSRQIPVWLPVVASWGAIAMIWTEIGALPSPDRSPNFNYTATLVAYLINVGLWVLLTPIVVLLARRFDVGMRPTLRNIRAHVGLCLSTAVVHTGVWLFALYAIESPTFGTNLRSMFGWAIWDVAAYIAIVALATVVSFSAQFRDSRLNLARAEAQLASARLASLRLRLQPRVLLASLDALARVVARDVEQAEATIARIGDLLRMLLSRADREFVSIGQEIDLLDAYLDVVQAQHSGRRMPIDVPQVTEVVDELIPAMLLPTLAASMHGEMEIVGLHAVGDRVSICVRSGSADVDRAAIDECLDRLRSLYHDTDKTSVGTDASDRIVVELDLPRTNGSSAATSEIYDLATA